MKLRAVEIQSLPGISRAFEIEGIRDGLNIISGPNGIGKSRLCTAVRRLLWPGSDEVSRALVARAVFEHGADRWQVERDPLRHHWLRAGAEADAPRLPPEHLADCFFLGLRDLFDAEDRAGRELAAEVRRQMSGNFDLVGVAGEFLGSVGQRIGQVERKAVGEAAAEMRRAQGEQAAVDARERALGELRRRSAEAESAAPRVAHIEKAIELRGWNSEAETIERELAALPDAMSRIDGKEVDRLDRLEASFAAKRRERDMAVGAVEAALGTERAARLDAPIETSAMAAWRERGAVLGDLKRDLDRARLDERAATRELAERHRTLGGETSTSDEAWANAPLSLGDDRDLFEFLRASETVRRSIEVVRTRLDYLADRAFPEEQSQRLKALRHAVEPLRAWLRAHDPELGSGRVETAAAERWGGAIGGGLGVAGLVAWWLSFRLSEGVAVAVGSLGLLAIGSGLAILAMAFWPRRSTEGSGAMDWRAVAQEQFPDTVDPPAEWSVPVVTRTLREMEDELSDLEASEKRARDREVDRGPLEQSLKEFSAREGDLEARRVELAERLALDGLRGDAELVDFARALDAAREADAALRSSRTRLRETQEAWQSALSEIADFVGSVGERAPVDVASARAAIDAVEARNRSLLEAKAEGRRQTLLRERIEAELAALEIERSEIFGQAGVDEEDRAALTTRVESLSRYRELKESASQLGSRIEQAESELARAEESELVTREIVDLEAERELMREKASERAALDQEIGGIERDAKRMSAGHVLEDAIAKREDALAALCDRRADELFAKAGAFLVDRVRTEYETVQMPRVLLRARDHFSAFTHHRYTLEIASDGVGAFVAISNETGEALRPERLSDGTRAQLILAARFAFAEEAEHGVPLPLFLDEAMDHSDPERFHAIARSLARMVRDQGRQIFYLTNDPTDVERFERAFAEEGCDAPARHDLAKIRGHAARVDRLEDLRVPALEAVPQPGAASPEEYGARIGVPRFDPSADASAQHPFYLLRDDLGLLVRLLEARLTTVGQAQRLLESTAGFADEIRDAGEAGATLAARIALFGFFCRAWREGRGRPIGRPELEATGAVSERFIEALSEVAIDLGGDARRLVEAIAERSDPRVHGYRRNSAEKLRRALADSGHLDERPILGEAELRERVIASPAANQLGMKVAMELVDQWWTLSHHSNPGADSEEFASGL